MPFPNGGDKYRQGQWYRAPGIAPLTLAERRQMLIRAGFDVPDPTAAELAQLDIQRRAQAAKAKK